MTTRLALDRFEGGRKQTAVRVADDGVQVTLPKSLLPKGCKAGDVLSLTIERDAAATKRVANETRSVQKDLKARDPGGDLKLWGPPPDRRPTPA